MVHWRTAPAVVALALGLAACGGGSSGGTAAVTSQNQPAASTPAASTGSDASMQDTIAGLTANDHGTKNVAGMSAVTIQAADHYFAPSVLQGTPGQTLALTIHNVSSELHNFTVTSQNVNSDIEADRTTTVHVKMPASGVISFFCQYHKADGMAGGLLTSGDKAGSAPATTQSSSSSTETGWG